MKLILRAFGVFVCWFTCNYAIAQEPFSRNISFIEGLPSQSIFDLYQDYEGYILIGSDMGLFKYNGTKFTQINFSGNLSNSYTSILEDKHKTLYCMNFSNQVFRLKNDTMRSIEEIRKGVGTSYLKAFAVVDDIIWVCSENKVFTYSLKTKAIRLIAESSETFLDLIYDEISKTVYFVDLKFLWSSKNGSLQKMKVRKGEKRILFHQGKLYYNIKGVDNIVVRVDDDKQIELISNNVAKPLFNRLVSTGEKLWLCTTSGLMLMNNKTLAFDELMFKSNRISDVLKDHEGSFWVSTLDYGLIYIPNIDMKYVENIQETPDVNYTRGTSNDDSILYAGTGNGKILKFDYKGNILKIFNPEIEYPIEFITVSSRQNKLFTSSVSIDLDKNILLDKELTFGKNLVEDDFGNYFVVSYNSTFLINADLTSLPNFENKKNFEVAGFSSKKSPVIYLLKKRSRTGFYSSKFKKYYVGSNEGLYVFDREGNQEILTLPDLNPIIATQMLADENGFIWIATLNNGVVKISDNNVIEIFNKQNGLSDNITQRLSLLNNKLWVLTNSGIDLIYTEKGSKIQNLQTSFISKGLSVNDIKAIKNKLVLFTNNGILFVDIQSLMQKHIPVLYVRNVGVNGVLSHLQKIDLPYNQNNLEFYFDAILFKSMGDFEYKYRLKGFDNKWTSQIAQNNKVQYLALPSGNYSFEIKAVFGDVESEIQTVDFVINKPFWRTNMFIAFLFLVLLSLILFVYNLALSSARKRELIKQKIVLSQLTALRSQMNPHFMFNILNSIQGLIYSNQKSHATEYLGKFSDLMRLILSHSDKRSIELDKELESLTLYIELEAARFNDNEFEYSILVDEKITKEEVKIPSMIIQPIVENAIKHGLLHKQGQKKLQIRMKLSDDSKYLEVFVEDNGVGREASAIINKSKTKHNSFATKAIDTRINLLNTQFKTPITIKVHDLKIDNMFASGTLVELKIPLDYE